VIDGPTLAWVVSPEAGDIALNFFKLGFISNSCICCRVSPA
jgi:magnesium-transporting ATPase (P-type)